MKQIPPLGKSNQPRGKKNQPSVNRLKKEFFLLIIDRKKPFV